MFHVSATYDTRNIPIPLESVWIDFALANKMEITNIIKIYKATIFALNRFRRFQSIAICL